MVVRNNARACRRFGSRRRRKQPLKPVDPCEWSTDGPRTKLGKALYRTSGGGVVTEIAATIHAGAAGNIQDAVTFEVAMGADGTDDDIVKVDITAKAGVTDVWKIALTPVKEGKQNVYVTVKDKFGSQQRRQRMMLVLLSSKGSSLSLSSILFLSWQSTA